MASRHRPLFAFPPGGVRTTRHRSYAVRGNATEETGGAVTSGDKPALSGGKGFALVLCGMLAILLALWGLAALVAP